ncbi:MAG: 4-phosphoerythronate dehydrogenase [Pseudomonadota bacterium]|nr:4-phosphoerythronate dehydrogenase [Pseudomonadota bacterium]
MEILADREITAAAEVFEAFGPVRLFDGRRLRQSDIGDAEILLVRSVTRIDHSLLAGTPVRFVGTATAGVDHVDAEFLTRRSIEFAHAEGCNARAVAEHVATCLYTFAALRRVPPRELAVGIIGYGNVGRCLATLLDRLGIDFAISDPPLAEVSSAIHSVSLKEIMDRDVVSLHVPLTNTGKHRTVDLIDANAINRLRHEALLINVARGGVVNEGALCRRLETGAPLYAAVDCWSNEPAIDAALLRSSWVATPHIAGHSVEARLKATRMLHTGLNVFCGANEVFPSGLEGPANGRKTPLSAVGGIAELLSKVHPLAGQSERLRRMLALPAARRGAHFDDIRARFGLRREFSSFIVASEGLAPDTVVELGALGFDVLNDD